jgi:hypothetical protein
MTGVGFIKTLKISGLPAFILALLTGLSHAALAMGPPPTMGTMGDVIENTGRSFTDVPYLLTGLAYLAGITLAFMAIFKLKEHVLNPSQTPLSEALKRFLAGGCCFALPIVLESAVNTITGADPDSLANALGFNAYDSGTTGLDTMFIDLLSDIWTPMMDIFSAFAYLAGIILILIGISRLLKSAQEGPRGPAGLGTIFTFLVGGVLLSFDSVMAAFGNSMLPWADGDLHTFGIIDFATSMTGPEQDHINSVIAAVLAFMMIVGWVSFFRGFFIIRQVAEGNHQASLMAGMTHVFGGALAVNLGAVLDIVQYTFGLTDLGISFY